MREDKSEMLNTIVKSGMTHKVEFDNVLNGDVVRLEYQHTYNRKTARFNTSTTEQRPDIVVTVKKRNGFVLTYLYDAKYRVQDDVKDGDMVICRTSAPLVKLCMLFLKKGTKAYIKGRDIGTSLIGLIRNTHKDTVKDVIDSLKSDGKKMVKKLCKLYDYSESDAENTSEYQNYIDKVNTIVELGSEIKSSESLIDKISELFSENNGEGICLSTVHKSKGLENERVFILNESAFYPKWAMNSKIQAEQEKNLEYVAITRSKKYLGYISNVEKNEE